MNFLAHSFLSCSDDYILLGNLIADMVRNKELAELDPVIMPGIELHRKIDSFTDTHPAVKRCTKLLHGRHGKYASVITDIFFDHLLFLNWEKYSYSEFRAFEDTVYQQLLTTEVILPVTVRARLDRMIDADWLEGYTTVEGMNYVFSQVAKRAKFDNKFAEAMEDFEEHYEALDRDFNLFFPEVISMASAFCGY